DAHRLTVATLFPEADHVGGYRKRRVADADRVARHVLGMPNGRDVAAEPLAADADCQRQDCKRGKGAEDAPHETRADWREVLRCRRIAHHSELRMIRRAVDRITGHLAQSW